MAEHRIPNPGVESSSPSSRASLFFWTNLNSVIDRLQVDMATQNADVTFMGSMTQVALYKRSQGRLVRQLTALSIAIIVLLGAFAFSNDVMRRVASSVAPLKVKGVYQEGNTVLNTALRYGVPVIVGFIGCWMAYRAVNYPRFADFLISVEAEMDKVSWPSMGELKRGTVVVITVMISLGIALSLYNWLWLAFFKWIKVIEDVT